MTKVKAPRPEPEKWLQTGLWITHEGRPLDLGDPRVPDEAVQRHIEAMPPHLQAQLVTTLFDAALGPMIPWRRRVYLAMWLLGREVVFPEESRIASPPLPPRWNDPPKPPER